MRVAGTDLRRPADEPGGPGRPVVVVRLDATVVQAAADQDGAEPNDKGYGFHPLTAWCTNVGDCLAAMLRPGSAGSFTAADHSAVLDAAVTQIPPGWRSDLLVTVDGAGASHGLVNHLTGLNTARTADGGYRRRVTYSVGWPVDARTKAAVEALREGDWTAALTADGKPDEHAQVAELTGLLRHSAGGDQLAAAWSPAAPHAHPVSRPSSARTRTGGTARSPPAPPPGSGNSSTPGTAPRPTSRTR